MPIVLFEFSELGRSLMSSVIQYQQKQSPGDVLQEMMLLEISENSLFREEKSWGLQLY